MNQSRIRIIPMTKAHIPACADIVASSEPWKSLRESVDFLPSMKRKQAFAAVIEGAVAGFVVFTQEPVFARGGYLRAIGVAPAIRGSGIGKLLMDFAEKATAKQAPNFFLCVSSFNRSAQAFYRKCGYTRVGKIDGLIRKGASEYIYWKKLR
jgi:ribosomal protein S18 acetylase RimI-like enzyme